MTESQIDELSKLLSEVRTEASKNAEYGFDRPFKTFLRLMSFLNPQSYGLRIQNRINKSLGWTSISASEDKGDIQCCDENKTHYELKASLITETNRALNLVQIRLWQNVSYLCFWFDVQKQTYSTYVLSHKQMEEETILLASAAHGTKTANEVNIKKELRISLRIKEDDEDFMRWEKNYKTEMLDFLFVEK